MEYADRQDADARRGQDAKTESDAPKPNIEEVRQGDNRRENLRVLDLSLLLALIALAVVAIYFIAPPPR
jgi:hypothetical protein